MAIAMTLQQYFTDNGITYETLSHPYTTSAAKTAQASHVPGDRIAKAVVVKGGEDYLLAVLPASHHIMFGNLGELLERPVDLATEEEVESLFSDCELGAIPPIGKAYGLDVVLDESLSGDDDFYFEGGDHATLVKVSAAEFGKLMENARQGRFSYHD